VAVIIVVGGEARIRVCICVSACDSVCQALCIVYNNNSSVLVY
jgi:hypothetical protein